MQMWNVYRFVFILKGNLENVTELHLTTAGRKYIICLHLLIVPYVFILCKRKLNTREKLHELGLTLVNHIWILWFS